MKKPESTKIDKSNMRQVILDSPSQLPGGIKSASGLTYKKEKTDFLVLAGVGGSALTGELLLLLRNQHKIFKKPIPLAIHKNYGLPDTSGKKHPLIICISYSGNTEETLDAYRAARAKKFRVASITTGGALANMARKDKTPLVLLPKTSIQPRSAVGYQLAALLTLLANMGIIHSQRKELASLAKSFKPAELERQGLKIARQIKNTTPLIYSSEDNRALSYIIKIKLNENAKTMAFANVFPELNHNEMVGLTLLRQGYGGQTRPHNKFSVIIIKDSADHPAIKKRMNLFETLAKKYHVPAYTVDINSERIYNRIYRTLLLGDWISYYLALFYKTDPTPVAIVEEFKKKMRR